MELLTVLGIALLCIYNLIKDVISPLVRNLHKKKPELVADDGLCRAQVDKRVALVEDRLVGVQERVSDFSTQLEQQGTVMNNKQDMIFAELKEIRDDLEQRFGKLIERIAITETSVGYLKEALKPRRGGD